MNKTDLNGWQNIGKLSQWLTITDMTINQKEVYRCIAQECVGYCNSMTKELGYTQIAKTTGLSIATIKRTVPTLLGKYVIKIPTNQHVDEKGKRAYAYKLNFELPNYPHLTVGNKEWKKEMIKLEKEIYDRKSVDMDVSDLEEKLKQLKENE